MSPNTWFTVHKEGLAQILARRGREFAILELLQNAYDEPGVTEVNVTLDSIAGRRGAAMLDVEDDAPEGFADLSHAWTLFAPSRKRGNPEQRGRWNLGEKLVLAICEEARIISTKGGVRFDAKGRSDMRTKRERGSSFTATIRFTQQDVRDTTEAIGRLLPPPHIVTRFNGEQLPTRQPFHTFKASLPTEIADEEGYLRPTRRSTTVALHEPLPGEVPMLYEMGIPVVETGDKYHVDIGQKVPLNSDRDNVRPAFLREVRTLVLNETYERLKREDATSTWAREALSDDRVEDRAVNHAMGLMFGPNRVAFDPSDPEANKLAVSRGYTVVHGGSLSGPQWDNARRAGAIQPAGQVTPSPKVLSSPDGEPAIPREDWTPAMTRLASYAQLVGKELLGFEPRVAFYRIDNVFSAWYGQRELSFNMRRLGRRWVEEADQERVDALLLHEFAHQFCDDHLSEDFHDAICRLGARLRGVQVTLASLGSWKPYADVEKEVVPRLP